MKSRDEVRKEIRKCRLNKNEQEKIREEIKFVLDNTKERNPFIIVNMILNNRNLSIIRIYDIIKFISEEKLLEIRDYECYVMYRHICTHTITSRMYLSTFKMHVLYKDGEFKLIKIFKFNIGSILSDYYKSGWSNVYNPIVDECNIIDSIKAFKLCREWYDKKELPRQIPRDIFNSKNQSAYHKLIGWAALTKPMVDTLAKFIGKRKVLEIFAGNGCLSQQLIARGCDVTATDDDSWEWQYKWNDNIKPLDCIQAIEDIQQYDLLLMSWVPSYIDIKSIFDICRLHKVNVIYIGEVGPQARTSIYPDRHFKEIGPRGVSMYYHILREHYQPMDGWNDRIIYCR